MPSCVVPKCKSYHGKKQEPEIKFHRFPKCPILHHQWLVQLKWNRPWYPESHHRVCSKHFEERFLVRQSHSDKQRLHRDAIPTIFPDAPVSQRCKSAKSRNSTPKPQSQESESIPPNTEKEEEHAESPSLLKCLLLPEPDATSPEEAEDSKPAIPQEGSSQELYTVFIKPEELEDDAPQELDTFPDTDSADSAVLKLLLADSDSSSEDEGNYGILSPPTSEEDHYDEPPPAPPLEDTTETIKLSQTLLKKTVRCQEQARKIRVLGQALKRARTTIAELKKRVKTLESTMEHCEVIEIYDE